MFPSRRKLEAIAGSLIGRPARAFPEDQVGGRSVNHGPAAKPKAGSATGGGGIEGNLRSNLAADHIVGECLANRALASLVASRNRPSREGRRSRHSGYRHRTSNCDLP